MRLAVAFHLGDLVQRFPTHARLGVLSVDRLAIQPLEWEHLPVGDIAVVGDGENASAGVLLVGVEVVPQVLRVGRVRRAEGKDLPRLVAIVLEDDDPVQIARRFRRGNRCPFEPDQSSESSGLVVLLREGDLAIPNCACHPRIIDRVFTWDNRIQEPLLERTAPVAGLHHVVDHSAPLVLEELGVGLCDHRSEPQVLGVV